MGYVLEDALSEYFVSHRANFPDAKLTIAIEQQPQFKKAEKQIKCMFPKCDRPATQKATRIYDNKILDVCIEHHGFCESTPGRFKVLT